VEVKIADDGEILARGPNVMAGYLKNPEATRDAIDEAGWLHTGDVGRIDADGFVSITDRKKDLIVTSCGKNIAPTELERLLVSDPLIDQAVIYGDGRPFVSALIVPNFSELHRQTGGPNGDWEESSGFIVDPGVIKLYEDRIAAVMSSVSQPERVRKFLLLSRPFQLDAEELTATLKVRRRFIVDKFARPLAALYESPAAEKSDNPKSSPA
jgi:long-chain acyl-CoA synthetase